MLNATIAATTLLPCSKLEHDGYDIPSNESDGKNTSMYINRCNGIPATACSSHGATCGECAIESKIAGCLPANKSHSCWLGSNDKLKCEGTMSEQASYLATTARSGEFMSKQVLERAGHITDTDTVINLKNNCNVTPTYQPKEVQRKRWSLFVVQSKVPACQRNDTITNLVENNSPGVKFRENKPGLRKRRQCFSMVTFSTSEDKRELFSSPPGKHTKRLSNGKLNMSNGLSLLASFISKQKGSHQQVSCWIFCISIR